MIFDPLAEVYGSYRIISAMWERLCNVSRTFHKLLACVLLEEGFVSDRTVKVIEHQQQDRPNLLFGVAGVVCKRGVLRKCKQDVARSRTEDLPILPCPQPVVRGTWQLQRFGLRGI